LISRGKDSETLNAALHIVSRVLREKLDEQLHAWHDFRIKRALAPCPTAPVQRGGRGSWWLDEKPVSSKLFAVIRLLITPKAERVISLSSVAGESNMSKEYSRKGRLHYEIWGVDWRESQRLEDFKVNEILDSY
jgi:hypothetical protein